MNPRDWVAAAITGLMATTAMLGSIGGLVAFAEHGLAGRIDLAGVTIPLGTLAFVAAVDGLAIAMTAQVHGGDGEIDRGAVGVLVAVTAFSAALQFMATPTPTIPADIWKVKTVHTVPAPFAAVAAAMFFRRLHSARSAVAARLAEEAAAARLAEEDAIRAAEAEPKREAKAVARKAVKDTPAPPPPPVEDTPPVPAELPPAAAEDTPAAPRRTPLEDARLIAAAYRDDDQYLSVRALMDQLKDRGHRVGKDTATSLKRKLEAEDKDTGEDTEDTPYLHVVGEVAR